MKIDSDELIEKLILVRDEPAPKGSMKKYRLNHIARNRISSDIGLIMDMANNKGRSGRRNEKQREDS